MFPTRKYDAAREKGGDNFKKSDFITGGSIILWVRKTFDRRNRSRNKGVRANFVQGGDNFKKSDFRMSLTLLHFLSGEWHESIHC